MALARIKFGRLKGRDYIKLTYNNRGHFPRVGRKWSRIPLEAAYFIEETNHPDFDVHYEVDEAPFEKEGKVEDTSKYDLDGDGDFDKDDISLAGEVLRKSRSIKKKTKKTK